jgi:hypothetical protein
VVPPLVESSEIATQTDPVQPAGNDQANQMFMMSFLMMQNESIRAMQEQMMAQMQANAAPKVPSDSEEVAALKKIIEEQNQKIGRLKTIVQDQNKTIEKLQKALVEDEDVQQGVSNKL